MRQTTMFPAGAPGSRFSRGILVLGEGVLAGMLAGGVLGFWEVWLGRDLAHGLPWLAVERMLAPMTAGGGMGGLISFLVECFFVVCHRGGRRLTRLGIAGLGSVALILTGLAAFWRLRLFPLYPETSRPVSIFFFVALTGLAFLLLALRARDAWWRVRMPASPAGVESHRESGAPRISSEGSGHGSGTWRWRGRAARASLLAAIVIMLGGLAVPLSAGIRSRGRRPILMVSIDTLRADRLGVYGASRPLSPGLDRLAREGIIFDQVWSAAPWTLPSHASLFTSLLPFEHRARWDSRVVAPKLVTLAERLRNAGYRTAAFTGGGYVSSAFGFGQGFETYLDLDEVKAGGPGVILESALDWVLDHRDEAFFLFVHTYEPHSPFEDPRFTNPEDKGRLGKTFSSQEVDDVHRGRLVLMESERRYVEDLYDGDAAHSAKAVNGFLERLEREGILDKLVLVLLSDHGEEFWEHHPDFSPAHGHSLYEEILRVPMVVRAPGLVPAGVRIQTPVSLIDVAPTLLEVAELEPEPDFRGRGLIDTLKRGVEPAAAFLWAESTQYGPSRFALRHGPIKVVLTPQPWGANNDISLPVKPIEVFDLSSDPGERHDLSEEMDAEAGRMVEILWPRVRRVFKPLRKGLGGDRLPGDLMEQLRSLGYVQ